MSDPYDDLHALYRAARAAEHASAADRAAVRLALSAAVVGVVEGAAIGSAVAHSASSAAVGSGSSSGITSASGLAKLLVSGKFFGGLCVGITLGAAATTTAYVVESKREAPVAATAPSKAPRASPSHHHEASTKSDVELLDSAAPNPTKSDVELLDSAAPNPTKSNVEREAPTETAVAVTTPTTTEGPRTVNNAASTRTKVAQSRDSDRTTPEDLVPGHEHDATEQLTHEANALAEVQRALNQHAPGRAIALLNEQDRAFPAGQLGEERAAARVIALCATGELDAADRARQLFMKRYQDSPLAKRVNAKCRH